jgi:short-subunit dehydrogenase
MARQGRGGIVLMSSLTAFMGTPFVSVYGASKAFDLALAEGIGSELEGRGVHVLACAPGAVATPNYLASIPDGVTSPAPLLQPDDVAKEALDNLGVRRVLVPGVKNRLLAFLLARLLPRQLAVRIMGSATRELYGRRTSGRGERP